MPENNYKTNIDEVSDVTVPGDSDGRDDFTETGQTPADELTEASGAKYDSVREAFAEGDRFFEKVGNVITKTVAGRNTVGKGLGLALDVVTMIAPAGSKIDRLRQKGKDLLNLNKDRNDMKNIIKRAFTTDGGGLLRIRDEDGNISVTAIGATLLRIALVVGVYYGAKKLGLPVSDILNTIGLG